MPDMAAIQLAQPIVSVCLLDAIEDAPAAQGEEAETARKRLEAALKAERANMAKELAEQKSQLAGLLQTINRIAGNLDKLYQEAVTGNRADIARLSVEIARKILMHEVARGGYDIQAIVEEALKQSPTRQGIVVRLNPDDLPPCQQYQQANPDSPFAALELAADWNVGRGECLVETPKGIVKSFIEEHLERISEALQKVE